MSEFKMPSLGADMEAAILVEWFVKPGDHVKRGDIIADIETDKGDIDVEVYEDGVVQELVAQPGDKLPVGAILAKISGEGEEEQPPLEERVGVPLKDEPVPEKIAVIKKGVPLTEPQVTHELKSNGHGRIKASPLAKVMAGKLGIDLGQVKGSGYAGVIHKIDVENYQKQSIKPAEPVEKVPVAIKKGPPVNEGSSVRVKEDYGQKMRRAIAAAMSRSNQEIPHYYLETSIDMGKALQWMENENRNRSVKDRLLPIAMLVKGVAKALADVPELNGFWRDGQLQVQESINIGLAVSLRQGGLVTPAIQDADLKSVDEIMANIMDITQRTRSGKLTTSELMSSTITLTSLGDRGVKTVFGVIYPPQVALVGMGKMMKQPWVENDMLGIKTVISVTLAGDHRASDGHKGGLFLEALNNYLQKPEEL